jgi:hypothetical protein
MMNVPLYDLSIRPFGRMLDNLQNILGKAAAHAGGDENTERELLAARLAPDMLPLSYQVQIVIDGARGAALRLAGGLLPDPETPDYAVFNRGEGAPFRSSPGSLRELTDRVRLARDELQTYDPAQINDGCVQEIVVKSRQQTRIFEPEAFILDYAVPNFYFHISVAYAILRHCGVSLGKQDFEGPKCYQLETPT